MRITPLDVRKQEFRRGMRGLDAEEVYAFLSTVADEYEAVLNDNKALRERLLELDDKVQEYRSMERTLRDTLLTAERVTVETKDNARREASLIVKEAQIEADKSLRNIRTEAMALRQQVQQLRSQREAYLARMKVVAGSHLDYIKSAQKDFEGEDETIRSLGDDKPRESDRTDPEPATLFNERPSLRTAVAPPERAPHDEPTEPEVLTAREPEVGDDPGAAPGEATAPVATAAEPSPEPAPVPGPTPPADGPGTISDINAIIERMRRGQRETLASKPEQAGSPQPAAPGPVDPATRGEGPEEFAPFPKPAPTAVTPNGRPGATTTTAGIAGGVGVGSAWSGGGEDPAVAARAVPSSGVAPDGAPEPDVTSEWNPGSPHDRRPGTEGDESDR